MKTLKLLIKTSFLIGLESRSRDFARFVFPGGSRSTVVFLIWLCQCSIGNCMSVTVLNCPAKVRTP